MMEGWICPRCGKVNAPWMPCCNCTPALVSPTLPNDWPQPRYTTDNPTFSERHEVTCEGKP